MLSACDAPPRAEKPAPPVVKAKAPVLVPSKPAPGALSTSEQCAKASRAIFQRDWKHGTVNSADGPMKADYRHHYHAARSTCFYLLTLASTSTLRKMLFDVDGGELYGEFHGPAIVESPVLSKPKNCRVESLYCASDGEWEVLVRAYMED